MLTDLLISMSVNLFAGIVSILPEVNFPKQIETAFLGIGQYLGYLDNFINVDTLFVVFHIWVLFQFSVFVYRGIFKSVNTVLPTPKKMGF